MSFTLLVLTSKAIHFLVTFVNIAFMSGGFIFLPRVKTFSKLETLL